MAKTIILIKPWAHLFFWAIIFQLKLLQITWSFKKCRRMDSLNIISYLSEGQNAEFLNSSKEGNKGKGSASVDCFARGDSGTFQDQHLFSSEVLSWSLLKPFGYKKRPLLSLFRQSAQITAPFDVAIVMHTRADPGFFLGGGALVSCSTSTPINHIFFCRIPVVLENRRSSQGGVRTPCTLPLDPPLAQLVSMMHSAKQGNYLKQPFIASQTLSYTVIL